MARKRAAPAAPRKHHTTLATAIDHASTLLVFGKPVSDLQPTADGHQFVHVFGYRQNLQCHRLTQPVLVSLPEPLGPANACGFDPDEFLMWQVPQAFLSTALHVERAPLGSILSRVAAPTAHLAPAAAPQPNWRKKSGQHSTSTA